MKQIAQFSDFIIRLHF